MSRFLTRREILRKLGIGAAALPFVWNLPSLCIGAPPPHTRKQRLVIMFSPNGVIPHTFWPDEEGELQSLKESLKPLEPFRNEDADPARRLRQGPRRRRQPHARHRLPA